MIECGIISIRKGMILLALKLGEINNLLVKRETDISYTLTDGKTDVFLHFNQALHQLTIGEKVDVFLYYDQKKRLCATMETPIITTKKYGKVKVVGINEAGVFVNIGIAKDILLSKDYLPNYKLWPQVNDEVFCLLKVKNDQIVARLIQKSDIIETPNSLSIGQKVKATVMRLTNDGIGLYTDNYHYLFVHKSLMRQDYRLGDEIEVIIIYINKNNEYNASTILTKEKALIDDSDTILRILKSRGGVIQLGNLSLPEEIEQELYMSKKAFKRAVGHLYKKRLITISDYRITLID